MALYYQSYKNYGYLYRRDNYFIDFHPKFYRSARLGWVPKLLALVFMALQDPIAITALNALLWLVWFTKSVSFIWLWRRISLCLPAAAIGKNMSLRESWRKTSEIKGQILLLAGVEVLVYFGISAADS